MDEDFFKDYPPVDGSFNAAAADDDDEANPSAENPGVGAFVLGESSEPADDADNVIIPGPPPTDSADAYTNGNGDVGPPPADDDQPENPAVTKWRAEFADRLADKLQNERKVKAERNERARKTLSTMHQRWDRHQKDAHDANRKTETELLRNRDATLSRMSKAGTQPNWNIVPELADLSGTFKEGARDTSRMRQVLLRMKTQ